MGGHFEDLIEKEENKNYMHLFIVSPIIIRNKITNWCVCLNCRIIPKESTGQQHIKEMVKYR